MKIYNRIIIKIIRPVLLIFLILGFCNCKRPNLPPYQPVIVSSIDRSLDQDTLVFLSWQCSDPENEIIKYDIYFGNSRDPQLLISDYDSAIYYPGPLIKDEIYYWKIVAKDGLNISEGPIWNFSTGPNRPPELPNMPYPVIGDNISTGSVKLSWDCLDPNDDPMIYNMYIGRNNTPRKVAIDISSREYDLGGLQSGDIYFWFVVSIDINGDYTVGPVWYFGSQFPGNSLGTLIDERDNNIYSTVLINDKWWMSENLKYHYPNGSLVYDYDEANESNFGRLYNWEAAYNSCPSGWHLPSLEEWEGMVNSLGGKNIAGSLMKMEDTFLWEAPNSGADNLSGFAALPGGYMNTAGDFVQIYNEAIFWTSSEVNSSGGFWATKLKYNQTSISFAGFYGNNAFSVRCIKD